MTIFTLKCKDQTPVTLFMQFKQFLQTLKFDILNEGGKESSNAEFLEALHRRVFIFYCSLIIVLHI